ncbi:VaFE repeat-containing surface-anchored protein [Varibaculum cambriense]|uniref:VaFE repeat-containing surface-anchored protein n=1 Tax=Varibaculum cambriense TaxID=184870 RepID=UPI002907DE35|nr:VaFE repeat-containing surface-anchored protein [Varibaculum cambriense]MDU7408063.1 VaFE repeat-containing surface-anchored protein [Varibaculum cambriense]
MAGAPKHWLGAHQPVTGDGKLAWCIEMGPMGIAPGQTVTKETLTGAGAMTNYGGGDVDLTNVAQVAWILDKYENVNTNDSRAAISMIIHFNLEINKNSAASRAEIYRVWGWLQANHPAATNLARKYVQEAKASGVHSYTSTSHTGEGKREGTITNIGIKNVSGNHIAGIPYTLTLKGPAVFTASGKNTLSGKTANKPITVNWRSTGNGKVSFIARYTYKDALTKLTGPAGKQRMIQGHPDPSHKNVPGGEWKVIYDFQPMATSKVTEPSVAATKGEISDTIKAFADPKYANPEWIKDTEVTYKGEVYYMGETLPAKAQAVPAGAKPVATTSLKFTAPGEQTATVKADKPGFYTWVWSVDKKSQKKPDLIHANWTDGYTVAGETQVKRIVGKITSKNNVIKVHSGSDAKFFLNDWVKVEGFPTNHPTFAGYGAIKADHKTIDQHLYCVPSKTKLVEGVTKGMTPVKSWTIPAKNGDYRIADYFPEAPGEHIQDIDCRGTLVFVSEFAGDNRVEPLRTSELDPNESFVPDQPGIHTTATDKADGDKFLPLTGMVTIKDKVTYRELAAGKEYTLQATLMDKATGKPFQDCNDAATVTDYSGKIEKVVNDFAAKIKINGSYEYAIKNGKVSSKALNSIVPGFGEGRELDSLIKAAGYSLEDIFGQGAIGRAMSHSTRTPDGKTASGGTVGIYSPKKTVDVEKLAKAISSELVKYLKDHPQKSEAKDCKPVTATKKFTPTHRNGVVEIDIPVRAELLAGKTTVVFEDVLREGKEPIVHHDINDRDQTVYSPDAKTTATDGKDGDKTVNDGNVKINDVVEYKSLIPGDTYTVTGKLMNKETGETVDCMKGKPVTFKADKSGNGKVSVSFFGNCKVKADTQWVVFEDIYTGKTPKGTHVVEHHDIDDVDQTVTVVPTPVLAKTGSASTISLLFALVLTGAGAVALYSRKRARQ